MLNDLDHIGYAPLIIVLPSENTVAICHYLSSQVKAGLDCGSLSTKDINCWYTNIYLVLKRGCHPN